MWVNVVADFKDKNTGEIHKVGDKIQISKSRFNEIKKVGNLVEIVDKKEEKEENAE